MFGTQRALQISGRCSHRIAASRLVPRPSCTDLHGAWWHSFPPHRSCFYRKGFPIPSAFVLDVSHSSPKDRPRSSVFPSPASLLPFRSFPMIPFKPFRIEPGIVFPIQPAGR